MTAWGTGQATREFLYVEDAAEAIVLAAEKYSKSDLLNLGSGQEISVRDLLDTIRGVTGCIAKVRWDDSKPDGQPRRCLDTFSAPPPNSAGVHKTPLREGLQKTADWYLANQTPHS